MVVQLNRNEKTFKGIVKFISTVKEFGAHRKMDWRRSGEGKL